MTDMSQSPVETPELGTVRRQHYGWLRGVGNMREMCLVLIILTLCAVMSFASPYFLSAWNLSDATFNFTEKAMIAFPMALLIIAGEIDLSVAAIIALFIVPPIVVSIIAELSVPDVARVLLLASPSDVVDGVNGAIYGPLRIGGETFIIATLPGWV